jgi:hypothetical protein
MAPSEARKSDAADETLGDEHSECQRVTLSTPKTRSSRWPAGPKAVLLRETELKNDRAAMKREGGVAISEASRAAASRYSAADEA